MMWVCDLFVMMLEVAWFEYPCHWILTLDWFCVSRDAGWGMVIGVERLVCGRKWERKGGRDTGVL